MRDKQLVIMLRTPQEKDINEIVNRIEAAMQGLASAYVIGTVRDSAVSLEEAVVCYEHYQRENVATTFRCFFSGTTKKDCNGQGTG